jgi:thiamine-triphosphatase
MMMTTSHKMSLEVEEKFEISDSQNLESRLKELGFVPSTRICFVDWYFDTEKNDLTLQDCWLRFREKAGKKGKWELKRGRGQNTSSTVYEEIEGQEAVSVALSMLPDNAFAETNGQIDLFEGFEVPQFTGFEKAFPLYPFCRLETWRSSWKVNPEASNNVYLGLAVDLDETNIGHSVGEVEMVVDDDSRVLDAKHRVQDLVAKLTEGEQSRDGPAVGKLEHFLTTRRPQHYAACVKSGVIIKAKSQGS